VITQDGLKWTYTIPQVFGKTWSEVPYTDIAYHTHPSGGLLFSNKDSTLAPDGGSDISWAQSDLNKNHNDLYLGVYKNGEVLIGVCNAGCVNGDPFKVGTRPMRTLSP
jgi:hypothetical protein